MRQILLILILLSLLPGPSGAEAELPAGRDFGAGLTLERATPLAEVAADPDRFAEEPILVTGRLTDVCQKKGCWTILKDGPQSVRVRFKDYGFFLPKDSAGSVAYVEGLVAVKTLSEKDARHYEAESQDGDPASIRGPQRELGFTASGVRLIAEP